ncbi:hypothetical protein GCM10010377_08150 [Streptomyces viridiviolaceus]|nr:hypothetical protein GCM10010377_08150 [Streptomyces viridiviolaceus]
MSEVAAEIDVRKSTAFRLLGALEARGLVEQATERGKYRLGSGIVRLAGAVTSRLGLTQQGRAVCERLSEKIGETVDIAVLQEHSSTTCARSPCLSQLSVCVLPPSTRLVVLSASS